MSGSGDSAAQTSRDSNSVQDLPSKYEKLAAEYAKIKAQAIVLKKAVVEEQKQNGDLKQTIRTQEQSLRKNEQEMESLAFRNQQLAKRVTILQDDLEQEKKAVKKGGKKNESSSATENNGVLDEDFKRLIQENAKLHTLVQEKEDEHSSEISTLNEQLNKTKRDLRESQQECKTVDDKYEPIISRLEQDRRERDAKLKTLENIAENLKSLQTKFNTLDEKYKQLEYFAENLSKHFVLDGLNSMQLNNVNLSEPCELYLHKCIVDILTALTSFFSQLRNRLSYLSDMTFQSKFNKIETLCNHGKTVIQKYLDRNSLEPVSIVEYRNLLDSLLDNVKMLNRSQHSNLPSNLVDFISHLIRIFNVLPSLFIEKTKVYISNNALTKVISEVIIFEQLHKCLRTTFQNETELELKSNLKNMEELTSVNDCFLESLATLGSSLATLGNALTQLLLGLNQPTETQPVHHTIVEFSKKAASHLVSHQLDNITRTNSTEKYQLQAEELTELRSVYSKQIEEYQNKVKALEKEKIAWQSQYETLMLRSSSKADNTAGDGEEDEASKLAAYYRRKINALVEEKQQAEGRAVLVSNECVAIHKRLEYLVDSEHELTELMVKWKQYAAQLKDELRSTTDNYETQLSVMSEHLVELNLDLNDKRDAIEQLNMQLSNKFPISEYKK
uniref:Protein phosphatase 1 regulatory subunit 21 n=1 Tax=Cacopsylla melanoneura TaxID=428564 RepID=A0A8D8PQW0_9HEMI